MRMLSRGVVLIALAISSFGQADNPVQAAMDKKDYATAVKLLRPLADQGDPQAQGLLGGLYAEGLGTKKNPVEAVTLWRKAAGQKLAPAQYNLGIAYGMGKGGKR